MFLETASSTILPVLGPKRNFSRISRIVLISFSKSYSTPSIKASAIFTAAFAA